MRQELARIVADIERHEELARQAARGALLHKVEVGKLLLAAKGLIARGEFGRWAHEEFGWSRQHVARHLQLGRNGTRVLQSLGPDASLRAAMALVHGQGVEKVVRGGEVFYRITGEVPAAAFGEEPETAKLPEMAKLIDACTSWRVRRSLHNRQ